MPTYVYIDKETGHTKDVFHSMSELENPSEATLAEITHEGRRMTRGVTAPAIAEFGSLSAVSKIDRLKKQHSPAQKQKMMQRSSDHAKKMGVPEMKHEVNKSLLSQGREILGR
jgi:predicted nucleic acid-binding Zn ribbon protein